MAIHESTRVFWQTAPAPRPSAPLQGSIDVDVLVVGGGYTGLSAARCLKEASPGLRVALIERETIGFGASGRNSGYLTSLIGHDLKSLRARFGVERGRALAGLGGRAVDYVAEVVRRYEIECELEMSGLCNPASTDRQLRRAEALHAAAAALGVQSELWDLGQVQAALGVERFRGGLWQAKGGLLQPYKLALGLAAAARSVGVEIYENTALTGLEMGRVIRAQAGAATIRARSLVIATNAYTREPRRLRRHFAPIHVYSVVSERLSPAQWAAIGGWPGRVGFYSLHQILVALRPTADGRILAATGNVRYYAGDRLHVAESADYAMLARTIEALWPALRGLKIESRWEGVIGVTLSDLPSFGRDPRHPNVVQAIAYCGHGVALASYAGVVVRDLVLERAPEDEGVALLLKMNQRGPWPPVPGEPLRSVVAALYLGALRGLDALDERAR